jgi:hypothetical protein
MVLILEAVHVWMDFIKLSGVWEFSVSGIGTFDKSIWSYGVSTPR